MIRYIVAIIAAITVSVTCKAQINAEQVMRVGINSLYFEDYMLSIQYFNRVIEAKPYLAKPYFYRAVAKFNLEDFSGAEADADEAIKRNPFLSDAYEVRGVARQNLGNYQGAIDDYDKALSQLPDNRGIMFNKSLAQSETGHNDEALATLDRLIEAHPGFDAAYTGRAKVRLAVKDTVNARADLDRALSLNPNSANAYVMRADISMRSDGNFQAALNDMNEAIKLQPRFAGYFINRAWLRYNLNDYFGAMADFDYALTLDPSNQIALFNRGLLRAEVSDNDRAVDDFTRVIEIDPTDVRALYNRSHLLREKRDYAGALRDLDAVIAQNNNLSGLVFERFELLDKMGHRREAMAEYDRAMAMSRNEQKQWTATGQPTAQSASGLSDNESNDDTMRERERRILANRFASLLTTDSEMTDEREYNTKSIRGRVQDRDIAPMIEGDFGVALYANTTELAQSTYFMADADRINATRRLAHMLFVTNSEPSLDDENRIAVHFNAIEQYTGRINGDNPLPIDYFGRAMEYITLHNYQSAIADLDRAIEMADDFTLAYLMRAVARHRAGAVTVDDLAHEPSGMPDPVASHQNRTRLQMIMNDLARVIELDPTSPFARFNQGNIYLETGDLTSALSAYTEAIQLKPDFGQAYYNRGYTYFKLGNRTAGTADLSRAGQMGIVPSYNLLKRMNAM